MLDILHPNISNNNKNNIDINLSEEKIKINIRGKNKEFFTKVGKILSIILPSESNTSSSNENYDVLWLSPDEWMIYFDENKNNVDDKVTDLCKTFDDRVIVAYAGVVRWPVGTFMKPHIDPHRPDQEPDLFAAVLYLNDEYIGGHTGFEECEVKPETGKLLVFSNSIYEHHVTKIEGAERFALNIRYNRK